MKKSEFLKVVKSDRWPEKFDHIHLKSLWYDRKGNWNEAHHLVDHLNDLPGTRIHAYLHRKEGDLWNADYWYRKAGIVRPETTLEEEWQNIVDSFFEE